MQYSSGCLEFFSDGVEEEITVVAIFHFQEEFIDPMFSSGGVDNRDEVMSVVCNFGFVDDGYWHSDICADDSFMW